MENIYYNISVAKVGDKVENDYDFEEWVKVENDIKVPENTSQIWCAGVVESSNYEYEDKYNIAVFHGGLNGGKLENKWQTYLSDISNVIGMFNHAWMIYLDNDCCDDVFYFAIGYAKEVD